MYRVFPRDVALLRISRQEGPTSVRALADVNLVERRILERQDLQAWLRDHLDTAFGNGDGDLLLVKEEFSPWGDSQRRIDLFAVDRDANLVVIELKRDRSGGHADLQGLRYAAMVSRLTFKAVAAGYAEQHGVTPDAASDALCEHFRWDEPDAADFGKRVRIILASQDFDPEITTTAIWLNEQDIAMECHRLLAYESENDVFLQAQRIVPVPNTEDYLVSTREKVKEVKESELSWDGYSWYITAKPVATPDERSIDDMLTHSFVSLAGATHVARLQQVREGDVVYVKGAPSQDGELRFIGIGRVTSKARPRHEVLQENDGKVLLDGAALRGRYEAGQPPGDPGEEHILTVDWLWHAPYEKGLRVKGVGVGIQTICAFKGEKPLRVCQAAGIGKPIASERAVTPA